MQSKKSFFNKTLFRKNLTRYWPLWGGLSIAGAFVPLYMVLALITGMRDGLHVEPSDFVQMLYGTVTIAGPAFLMGYAIVCAMLIWSYLYSPRAVGLMHTLPVSRTCLFVTNVLSGLAMMAIPFAIVGGLLCIVALAFGMFDLIAVMQTVAAVILLAVLFFGIATLCAMLTGHSAVLPVVFLLVNFLAEILEVMVSYLTSGFLLGVPSSTEGRLLFLTPLLRIYAGFYTVHDQVLHPGDVVESVIHLKGLGTVAVYGLAGVVLLVLSWLLYRRRQSERAGDIVAYRPLRPVFRYGVALLSALTLGQLINEIFWETLQVSVSFSKLVPMMVCMSIAGVIGYYIASMLLEKSLRVFKGSLRGVLTVCAGAVILCAAVSLDPLGLENKVPGLDEIIHVELYGSIDAINFDTSTEEGREMVEQILDLHQAILDDKDHIYENGTRRGYYTTSDDGGHAMNLGLYLRYELKDGSHLYRNYTVPFYESRMKDPNTYDGKLYQLVHSDTVLQQQVQVPEGSLVRVSVYGAGMDIGEDLSGKLYEALLQDVKDGNTTGSSFPYWDVDETFSNSDIWLAILYTVDQGNSGYRTDTKDVELNWGMTHTIDALVAEGYFTQEQLDAARHGNYDLYEPLG